MDFQWVYKILIFISLIAFSIQNCAPACPCGSICVNSQTGGHCMSPTAHCECRSGCLVFHSFIAAGSTKSVHCKSCTCPSDPAAAGGQAVCTGGWCAGMEHMDHMAVERNCP